jgi:hypothetical protein
VPLAANVADMQIGEESGSKAWRNSENPHLVPHTFTPEHGTCVFFFDQTICQEMLPLSKVLKHALPDLFFKTIKDAQIANNNMMIRRMHTRTRE